MRDYLICVCTLFFFISEAQQPILQKADSLYNNGNYSKAIDVYKIYDNQAEVHDQIAKAYPIFAQQNYQNPREPNGRIVCANCHLAQKPVELEVPQAVLPDSVFEASIKIPYDKSIQQVQSNGKKGDLNVGMVLILPDGFSLAPTDRIPEEMKTKVGQLYYQPYSDNQSNILLPFCESQKIKRL